VDVVNRKLRSWGGETHVRQHGYSDFISDNGNLILDWWHGPIDEPEILERKIKEITVVVDTGIFANTAARVIVAGDSGIRKLDRPLQR